MSSFDWRGQRFCGSGLGPNSEGFRIDVFGNPGDYLGSGSTAQRFTFTRQRRIKLLKL